MHNTESERSTQIRNLRPHVCDDPVYAARPPMRVQRFLKSVDPVRQSAITLLKTSQQICICTCYN